MSKLMKSLGLMVAMGGFLVAVNIGGIAGCGDDGGSSGSGIVDQDVAAARLLSLLGNISSFTDQSGTSALTLSGEKSQTDECVFNDTEITCPCEGGGDFTFNFTSDTEFDLTFNNCIDADTNLLDGNLHITSTSDTSSTIDFEDLFADFGECGSFTISGNEVVDGSNITIDLTARSGDDTVNIDGELISNDDETISGTVDYTGAIESSCTFDHTSAELCPEVAAACGFASADICDGDSFLDVCVESTN